MHWIGLSGAGAVLRLAEAAAGAGRPLLVIAADAGEATRLEDELRFFAPAGLPVLAFPGYETLPYDQFSPHPDIISQRLRALARLPTMGRGLVVTDLPTALQRLAPRTFLDGNALSLEVGQPLDLAAFRVRLATAGYASALREGLGKIIIQERQHGGGLHQITSPQIFLIQYGAGIEEVLRVEKTRGLMVMKFAARLRRLRPLCLLERHDVFHEDAAIAGLPIPTARQRITKCQALE